MTTHAIETKFCGLHGAHVKMSEHNGFGACACLYCTGNSCQTCTVYQFLRDEMWTSIDDGAHTRCVGCICKKSKRAR